MRRLVQKIVGLAGLMGFDLRRFFQFIRNMPRFVQAMLKFRAMSRNDKPPFRVSELFPILYDFDQPAGTAQGHYFYQDLWAARKIYAARPGVHIDIGSRVDGFVAHLLTFMPVKVIDVRPLISTVDGLTFMQGDATCLSDIPDNSVESLSSLHAIEHFGLGRYGDPIDPAACFKAMRELARVLKVGGHLYFSVPIGVERVQFNAHRVFAASTILRTFKSLELISFSAVGDQGEFHDNANPDEFAGARLACGLFEFGKTSPTLPGDRDDRDCPHPSTLYVA